MDARAALALSAAPLLAALALVYATVLRFRGGFAPPPGAATGGGYLDSPYWLGLPRWARRLTAALQVAALGGYVAWLALALLAAPPPSAAAVALHALFLAAEAAWPLAAYAMLHRPGRLPFVLLACAPLLVAAAAAVGLLLASRAAGMGPASTVALAPAVAVAVAADAVGWTLAAWRTRGD